MMNGKRLIAIIPARGGSKGIKDKNIRPLGNKPLIGYTIESAIESKVFDMILVTTDSEQIASIAKIFGAEVPFLRPKEISRDDSKTIEAVVHAIEWLKTQSKSFDIVVLLQPTQPFRTSNDIVGALKIFFKYEAKSLAGICEVEDHPVFIRTIDSQMGLTKLVDINSSVRRQDLQQYYRINGAIYINQIQELSNQTSFNDNTIGYIMSKEKSIDIDDELDFKIAEALLINNRMPSKEG